MKQTVMNLYDTTRSLWIRTPALRLVTLLSVPALWLGLLIGGIRTVMLLTGYIQLVYRVVLPGEPVENGVFQRATALAAGLTRMLFFTGMMTHAVWLFAGMAFAQAFGLLILELGERSGKELSPLPLLSGCGFLLAGLAFGASVPVVWIALSSALALTLLHLLLRGKRNLRQLRMRFHLA